MRLVVRCIAVALLAPALLPASALGDVTVEVDQNIPLIRITGDAATRSIGSTSSSSGSDYVITSANGDLAAGGQRLRSTATCRLAITCPRRPSINVDLGVGTTC